VREGRKKSAPQLQVLVMETPAGQGEEDQYKGPLVDEKEVRSICSSLGISVLSIVKACHRVTYSLRFGDRVSSSGTKEWILSSIEGQQGFTAQTEDHFLVENFWCDNVAEALAEAPNLEVALQGAAEVYDIIAGNVGSNDDEDGSSDAVSHFCYDDEGAATSCGGDNKATGDWSDSDLPMPLTKRAKLMSNHAMAPTAITRLMRDLKRVQRLDTASLGFSLEPSEQDSIAVWDVRLFGFKDCELEGDLERLKKERGMDGVLLEINFPSDYPYAPPAVRVVRPRFQVRMRQLDLLMSSLRGAM
jgi:hypothetical protein